MSETYTLTIDELSSTAVPAFFVFAKSNTANYELIIYSFDYLDKNNYNTLTANIRAAVKNKSYTIGKTDSNKLEVTFEFNNTDPSTRQTFYMDVDIDPLPVTNELYSRIANTPAPLVATL